MVRPSKNQENHFKKFCLPVKMETLMKTQVLVATRMECTFGSTHNQTTQFGALRIY